MKNNEIVQRPLHELVVQYPAVADFLNSYSISAIHNNNSFLDEISRFTDKFWEENSTSHNEFIIAFSDFIDCLENVISFKKIENIEVLAGVDKSGVPEKFDLLLKPGEINCIVGPTGSGKSRLLADIEWLADGDTPTKRRIRINGELPDEEFKKGFNGKLIAQITQNMNFVLDMDVQGFLLLHAQSLFVENAESKVKEVIELANDLSGERFDPKTPVTFLSGGQSRALMISDVACIGQAPIVLIDELENAGIDKKKAFELLVNQEKIVLMATHDPLLILQADKRIVIKNGGIQEVISTNNYEKAFCTKLENIDINMQFLREYFRKGNSIDKDFRSDLF
jgi:ABC-type lipoprotein export system ATPase subunit